MSDKTVHHRIEDWSTFVGYLSKPSAGHHAVGYTRNFHYSRTKEQAIQLAIEGWPKGLEEVEKLGSLLDNELKGSLLIDEYFYDVSGQDFDLDRVLIGEPESWLSTEQVEIKAPATHTVRLVVNGATYYGVTPEQMIARGAAIIALVTLLERGRKRVEIDLVFNVTASMKVYRQTIPLKSASQDIDMNKIVFALANPDSCRRLQFATWDALEPDTVAARGHGAPLDITVEQCETEGIGIYVGSRYTCDFTNVDAAKRWIVNELKKQGVELKEETV